MAVEDEIPSERDCGVVRCGMARIAHKDVLALAKEFGLSDDPSVFEPIDESSAVAIVALILHKDMAYSQPLMPEERARFLAEQFLEQFGADAQFFGNGWQPDGWSPATDATFDTGVLIIGKDRSGCLWVEDED